MLASILNIGIRNILMSVVDHFNKLRLSKWQWHISWTVLSQFQRVVKLTRQFWAKGFRCKSFSKILVNYLRRKNAFLLTISFNSFLARMPQYPLPYPLSRLKKYKKREKVLAPSAIFRCVLVILVIYSAWLTSFRSSFLSLL